MAIEWVNSPQMFRNDGSALNLTSTSLWAGLFTAVTTSTTVAAAGRGGIVYAGPNVNFFGVTRTMGVALTTRHFGARVSFVGGVGINSGREMFAIFDLNGIQHITITRVSDSAVEIRRGNSSGTVLATSEAGVAATGTTGFFSVIATIADAGGAVTVYRNGAEIATFTGDTRNGGTDPRISAVRFGTCSAHQVEDLYIGDTSGPAPFNAPLSDLAVDWDPTAGNGDASDYTVTGAASASGAVNDSTGPDGDTSYIEGEPGDKHLFTIGALPEGAKEIYGVQHCTMHKRTDAGGISVKQIIKTGGTEYEDWSGDPTTGYNWRETLHLVNPDTGDPWTPAEVAALQIGVEYP